jgi:hypothetical protein
MYGDERMSKTVAAAVSPDNLQVPDGLVISTVQKGRRVVSVVKLEGRAETLLATLDDLLACVLTSESML